MLFTRAKKRWAAAAAALLCLGVTAAACRIPAHAAAGEAAAGPALKIAVLQAKAQKAALEALAREQGPPAKGDNGGGEPPAVWRAPATFLRETRVVVNDEPVFHVIERFTAGGHGQDTQGWRTLLVEPPERAKEFKPRHEGADGTFAMYAFTVGALDPARAEPIPVPADGDEGLAYFRFPEVPAALVQGEGAALADKLSLIAGVDSRGASPFVRELRVRLNAPSRIKLIAKVQAYDWRVRYRPLAAGSPVFVPEQMTIRADFKVMFKGRRTSFTEITYRDWRPVAAAGSPASADLSGETRR